MTLKKQNGFQGPNNLFNCINSPHEFKKVCSSPNILDAAELWGLGTCAARYSLPHTCTQSDGVGQRGLLVREVRGRKHRQGLGRKGVGPPPCLPAGPSRAGAEARGRHHRMPSNIHITNQRALFCASPRQAIFWESGGEARLHGLKLQQALRLECLVPWGVLVLIINE